jgi:hypothetical protein
VKELISTISILKERLEWKEREVKGKKERKAKR